MLAVFSLKPAGRVSHSLFPCTCLTGQVTCSCLPGKVPHPKTLSLGQARMVGHLMFMKILRGSSPKLVFSSVSN